MTAATHLCVARCCLRRSPMPEQTDREMLTEVKTLVGEIHREMTQPEGKVPKLEAKVDDHAKQINTFKGSVSTLVWIIGGIGILMMAFGGAFLEHVWGGGH